MRLNGPLVGGCLAVIYAMDRARKSLRWINSSRPRKFPVIGVTETFASIPIGTRCAVIRASKQSWSRWRRNSFLSKAGLVLGWLAFFWLGIAARPGEKEGMTPHLQATRLLWTISAVLLSVAAFALFAQEDLLVLLTISARIFTSITHLGDGTLVVCKEKL